MKAIIRQYYIIPFIGFFILFVIKSIGIKSPNSLLENALITIAGALLLSLIIGTIYYFLDTKWGPARREKKFSKPPFSELLRFGFTRKDDFLVGKVNGYTVIVIYGWPGGKPAIKIDILFDPKVDGQFLTGKEIVQLEKRNKKSNLWTNNTLDWTRNSVGHMIEYNFFAPGYEKIIAKAEEMTTVLTRENLRPISFDKTQEITPELMETIGY